MAAACEERNLLVKVPGAAAETGTVTLSPFDIANIGRATPMTWFYEETLDADALLQSLAETLTSYQVLSGRYAGTPMPTAINLVNAGVPVRICSAPGSTTMADAVAHLPGSSSAGPAYFTMHTHEAYVSEKASMDPDPCSADAPLLKIQITYFAGGGTAIGQLGMHGVVDAFSQIALFINWSRAFRNLPIALPPTHERSAVDKLAVSSPLPAVASDLFKSRAVAAGETAVPEFAPVLSRIRGDVVACVPFSKERLGALVEAARAGCPEGVRISVDDVLTARAWRALALARCEQLEMSLQREDVLSRTTTCQRAFNLRQRTAPPLGQAFFGNGVTQIWTELTLRELCVELSVAEVAQKLRSQLLAVTPAVLAHRAHWYRAQQQLGCRTPPIFDEWALTFIVSSWMFDWEAADFSARPLAYDHGALVPIVCNFTPRPNGDGVLVYATGTHAAATRCGELLSSV